MINKFFALHRTLRISALSLALTITASAYVIDIEFDGPGRHIQEMERENNRGREEFERRSNGDNLSEKEEREANHYEFEHMV